MRRRSAGMLCCLCLLLAACPALAGGKRVVAIVQAGPAPAFDALLAAVKDSLLARGWLERIEFVATTPPPLAESPLAEPPLAAAPQGAAPESARRALDALSKEIMARKDVDLVLALGAEACISLLQHNNNSTPILGMGMDEATMAGVARLHAANNPPNFSARIAWNQWRQRFALYHEATGFHRLGFPHAAAASAMLQPMLEQFREIGRERGVELLVNDTLPDAPGVADCERVLLELIHRGAQAMALTDLACFQPGRGDPRRLFALLQAHGVHSVALEASTLVQQGALMGVASRNLDRTGSFHAARIVRILEGAPTDTRDATGEVEFGLALNLEAAHRLGLDLPMSLLLAADELYHPLHLAPRDQDGLAHDKTPSIEDDIPRADGG